MTNLWDDCKFTYMYGLLVPTWPSPSPSHHSFQVTLRGEATLFTHVFSAIYRGRLYHSIYNDRPGGPILQVRVKINFSPSFFFGNLGIHPRCLTVQLKSFWTPKKRWMELGVPIMASGFPSLKFSEGVLQRTHVIKTGRNTGWWFQIFYIFTPIWGRFPIWLIFFKWVETTNQNMIPSVFCGHPFEANLP